MRGQRAATSAVSAAVGSLLTLILVASTALKVRSLDTLFLGIATVMVLPDSVVPAVGYALLMAEGVIGVALMAPML